MDDDWDVAGVEVGSLWAEAWRMNDLSWTESYRSPVALVHDGGLSGEFVARCLRNQSERYSFVIFCLLCMKIFEPCKDEI